MADSLILQGGWEQVVVVAGHLIGGSTASPWRVRKLCTLTWPAPEMDAATRGAWLREQLAALQITVKQTTVLIPRDEAVVRRLDVPEVPDAELPELVKFQAAAKWSTPIDKLVLDFLPLRWANEAAPPRTDGTPATADEQKLWMTAGGWQVGGVLAVTIPQAELELIQQCCSQAGLELQSVGFLPQGLAALREPLQTAMSSGKTGRSGPQPRVTLSSLEETAAAAATAPRPDDAEVIVRVWGGRVEIVATVQSRLCFTHQGRAAHTEDQPLAGILSEVSRALVSFRATQAGRELGRIWLIADSNERAALSAALHEKLQVPVEAPDLFKHLKVDDVFELSELSPGEFAAVIGGLSLITQPGSARINFLSPRKHVVQKDPTLRRKGILGGGVAVAILVLIGSFWLQFADVEAALERVKKEEKNVDELLARGQPILKSKQVVQAWVDRQVPWLDEWQKLSARLPATERIYLTSVKMDPTTGTSLGKIRLDGNARLQGDMIGWSEAVVAEKGRYVVAPHTIRAARSDTYYPWRFELELALRSPEAASPKSAAGKSPPANAATATKATTAAKSTANTIPDVNIKSTVKETPGAAASAKSKPSETKSNESKSTEGKPAEVKPNESQSASETNASGETNKAAVKSVDGPQSEATKTP